jgi:hypothetical protein
MSLECPWATLNAATLSAEQMFWLADTITAGRSTAVALARLVGLKPRLLYKLVNRAKYNKTMMSRTGRVNLLDKHSIGRIKWLVAASPLSITDAQILENIDMEYQKTAGRRRLDPASLKPLSRRSSKRYLGQFLAFKALVNSADGPSLAELLTADDSPPIVG